MARHMEMHGTWYRHVGIVAHLLTCRILSSRPLYCLPISKSLTDVPRNAARKDEPSFL